MPHRIEADRDTCIGAGQCTTAAGYFRLGDDGLVEVIDELVPDEDLPTVQDAVVLCPVEAIRLREAEK